MARKKGRMQSYDNLSGGYIDESEAGNHPPEYNKNDIKKTGKRKGYIC